MFYFLHKRFVALGHQHVIFVLHGQERSCYTTNGCNLLAILRFLFYSLKVHKRIPIVSLRFVGKYPDCLVEFGKDFLQPGV